MSSADTVRLMMDRARKEIAEEKSKRQLERGAETAKKKYDTAMKSLDHQVKKLEAAQPKTSSWEASKGILEGKAAEGNKAAKLTLRLMNDVDLGKPEAIQALSKRVFELGHLQSVEGAPEHLIAAMAALAEAGDQAMMMSLGRIFVQGKRVQVDLRQAHRWYGLAAEGGDPKARKVADLIAAKLAEAEEEEEEDELAAVEAALAAHDNVKLQDRARRAQEATLEGTWVGGDGGVLEIRGQEPAYQVSFPGKSQVGAMQATGPNRYELLLQDKGMSVRIAISRMGPHELEGDFGGLSNQVQAVMNSMVPPQLAGYLQGFMPPMEQLLKPLSNMRITYRRRG